MSDTESLASEDLLRLQILVRQAVRAIRIDENAPSLSALTDKGEAHMPLHPTLPLPRYLRLVREFLSEHYLQRPGGYPLHLGRWTRMGASTYRLDRMLLLGEPEAVVSVACAPALPLPLAEACWWALPTAEIARRLLDKPEVQVAALGRELAAYLLDFLPFEENPLHAAESVRLCLLPGLLDAAVVASLWQRAQRRNPYYLGFLQAGHPHYPPAIAAHSHQPALGASLQALAVEGNAHARALLAFIGAEGRRWLALLQAVLQKPSDEDVVIAAFRELDRHLDLGLPTGEAHDAATAAMLAASDVTGHDDLDRDHLAVRQAIDTLPATLATDAQARLVALRVLAFLGEGSLDAVLAGSHASGTVLRRRIAPLVQCINASIAVLTSD